MTSTSLVTQRQVIAVCVVGWLGASSGCAHVETTGLDDDYGDSPTIQVLTGKASYYHDSLHGNLTANGEVYNKRRISAAHLTLPFCTVVRVIRLDTGDKVIVRINDRGPYGQRGRILDLSRAAAKELDMIERGLVPIRAEIVEMGDGCTFHHQHR